MNLRKFEVDIDTAKDGKEAVEKFSTNRYDLIFMDVAMPHMDGLSATQIIRELETANNRVPIIGITASESRERCLAAGMDDYILKPPDYRRVLQEWLPSVFTGNVQNG